MKEIAYIFDMNGVLILDEHFHEKAFAIALERRGDHLTHDDYEAFIMGRTDEAGLEVYQRSKGLELSSDECIREKMQVYYDLLGKNLEPPQGLIELLRNLSERHPIGLTTNASKKEVAIILGAYGIQGLFDTVVAFGDFKHGKPDPEPYLLTATRLGVLPENCIVFEDTAIGVRAAKGAGMKCIAITSTQPKERLSQADKIINTFSEIDEKVLVKFSQE